MHPSDVQLFQIPAALAGSWHLPLIVLLSYSLYAFAGWNSKRRRMPPGPKGLPFIGSGYKVPAIKPWRKFAEWNRQYGSSATFTCVP